MSARSSTKSQLPATTDDNPSAAAKVLSQILERGTRVQGPAIKAYVDRLRQHNPEATPADIVKKLEKHYLAAVMASGAAVGSAAAFPGIGTLAALSAVAGETVVFLEATSVYVLALGEVYGIPADHVGWYLLPFAIGNFLGPVMLGRLFDTVGRRPMIALTYALSGVLLALTGYLFAIGALSATSQTIAWTIIFFFASAAASSAYLTVSETFPLEVRALAIAFFYAVGTGVGGVVGPGLFGVLIETGSRTSLALGYGLGAAFMLAAAVVAGRYGVAAERKPLEAVARPLSAVDLG